MTTFHRQVCLLGAAGVGKTSLVRRMVEGIFSERYLSTIGVKVDRAVVAAGAGVAEGFAALAERMLPVGEG